ncbi:hypothetical protein MACH26_29190 [Planctobacterium marinum]|uniref:histidine kinase n=2 Tax=Planctobacterium marinum TaxID=1631968 RepID=A0AA48KRC1_9ALTE|nr:hypothetical protein MACH26_29190 [Planctobacterium marinum]
MWQAQTSIYLMSLVVIIMLSLVLMSSCWIKHQVTTQFYTLANLLEAVSEGDYSLRGKQARKTGALAELTRQINRLSDTLTVQRHEVKESQLLLSKIISHIDVAVFAWNEQGLISLVNPAACALCKQPESELLNSEVKAIVPGSFLTARGGVLEHDFAGKQGKFHVFSDHFMEQNHRHTLLFINHVEALLRAEELKAWKNLIRVLSHEINNSLVPIQSLSELMLQEQVVQDNPSLKESTEIVSERARSLSTFIAAYKRLTHTPKPKLQALSIAEQLRKVTLLFPEQEFSIQCQLESPVQADAILLQQLLINLVKNAIEAQCIANVETAIEIKAAINSDIANIIIRDHGNGINNPENLFVPFYSTKADGSGIGLALSRQIIEAHHGQLKLQNHPEGGCEARLSLPAFLSL